MKRVAAIGCLLAIAMSLAAARRSDDAVRIDRLPIDQLGGPATVDAEGPNAFGIAAPGLDRELRRAFSVGNSFFRDNWIVAPASAQGRDGLGPLFNANSCSACHPDDGRGRPPRTRDEVGVGMVVFLSPYDADGSPHPTYGGQLQDQAIPGVQPEARILVVPEFVGGRYADGVPYELRRWKLEFVDEAYGPLGAVRTSMRLGQQIIGVGLLEAIDDASIIAMSDPDDRNVDGISGRANRVQDSDGTERIGRFGWKATQPTIERQVIAALHGDIGITSDARPNESTTSVERATIERTGGVALARGAPEIDPHKIARIAHYCRVLAVPRQRGAGTPTIERGRALFATATCAACHVPELRTGDGSPLALFRNVTIRPFTDLLLHDMGEGLADHRSDGDATGREWRTPPLWGIGLLETVNGDVHYLHDGRARTLEEAVLWHSGEAQDACDKFAAMSAEDRAALIAFLESL